MAGGTPKATRGRRKGVSVTTLERVNGARYTARYTLADGTRVYIPKPADTWDQAFREACDRQDAVERGTYRSENAMTFAQLAHDHFLPRYSSGTNLATTTYRTVDSHFGDGTGQPRRKGRKNELGARFALLYVFGRYRLSEISPAMINRWQDEMLAEGYLHSTVLAKRSVLKNCLELARVNGWLKGVNPVEAVAAPIKRERQDDDRAITPQEWGLIRAQLSGEGTTLLFDITLDTGLRFQEITGLRPMDVIDAADKDPAHLYLRQVIAWPGRKYNKVTPGQPWHAKEPKGRRFRKVAISREVHQRLLTYIDNWSVEPHALVFDVGRLRAEHAEVRETAELPKRFPKGRYVNAETGRSGEHGRYTTYQIGCRCPFCRNDYSQYRFWWSRRTGRRQDVRPWTNPEWVAARAGAIDPVSHSWLSQTIWASAVRRADLGWMPTPHDLRHARATWALEFGGSQKDVQRDLGHAHAATTEIYLHRLDDRVGTSGMEAMAKAYALMTGMPDVAPEHVTDPMRLAIETWFATLSTEEAAQLMTLALQNKARPDLRVVVD